MNPPPASHRVAVSRSLDSYIRITFDTFSSLDFRHRRAWEDRELCEELILEDVPACRAGYCEWATDGSTDAVSMGWGWFRLADGRTLLAPGGISSNIMLVARSSHDLGMHRTNALLQSWLTGEHWQADMMVSGVDRLKPGE